MIRSLFLISCALIGFAYGARIALVDIRPPHYHSPLAWLGAI